MSRVYTYGVFDLLHVGHIESLNEARGFGHLVVGVYSDEVAKGFKREPIIPAYERKIMLESLKMVDEVVYQDEYLPNENIKKYNIGLLVKGPGAEWDKSTEDLVKCIKLNYHPINSTTQIINKINENCIK